MNRKNLFESKNMLRLQVNLSPKKSGVAILLAYINVQAYKFFLSLLPNKEGHLFEYISCIYCYQLRYPITHRLLVFGVNAILFFFFSVHLIVVIVGN
jgi:hypothetical protein